MSAHESIMQGLNEALDHVRGKDIGACVHHVEVPTVDVAAIKARTGLSQSAFARSIGVAKGREGPGKRGRSCSCSDDRKPSWRIGLASGGYGEAV